MSAVALKLGALAIRTLAKPIATRIKSQARDHPRFRHICISIAQRLHRFDMRLRLGLLRDTSSASIEKAEKAEAARRHAEALKKLKGAEAIYPSFTSSVRSDIPAPGPTAPVATSTPISFSSSTTKPAAPRIRPLSESKAIDAGANFISEFFLFAVAGSLILAEALRSHRKEANRRDTLLERLDLLETRNRQDMEHLQVQDRVNRLLSKRLARVEEDLWRIKGGEGEYHHKDKKHVQVGEYNPSPLWAPKTRVEKRFWERAWKAAGKRTEGEREAEVVVAATTRV